MNRSPLSRVALWAAAAALVFLPAARALAYVIVLKDGTRIVAREKPNVQGKSWVFVVPSGNRQSIPISEVDMEKTEKVNAAGTGDAYELDQNATTIQQTSDTTRKPSISEYIKTTKKTDIGPESVPTPATASQGASRPSGAIQEPSTAAVVEGVDPAVSDAFVRAFAGASLRGARLTPMPKGVRVQAITDTEQQVFASLGAVARGLKEARALGKPLDRAEIVLGTSSGENAGKFLMNAEDADALLNGRTSAARYFVANVVF
ncbi:hypothetical protein FBQ97_04390 [Acidobacteria bacterium ACD]|nr:MAG: hypothetical protein EDX89_06055 [Acidobacteriota bacterium]MCE7959917.1 hypothetical protein [Acidobacteria bacterium ACB2]MDL1949037.1 hypothetical protein [Acidobacteria bacterium ACD]